MPGLKREAEAPIVQEDAARTGDEVPKPLALELMSDTYAAAVDHAQIRRVAVEAGGGDLAGPSEIDRGPSIRNALGIEEPNRVGSVEEFGRPVVPGLDRRLDEDMRAETVVVKLDPVRNRCGQQGEVLGLSVEPTRSDDQRRRP